MLYLYRVFVLFGLIYVNFMKIVIYIGLKYFIVLCFYIFYIYFQICKNFFILLYVIYVFVFKYMYNIFFGVENDILKIQRVIDAMKKVDRVNFCKFNLYNDSL